MGDVNEKGSLITLVFKLPIALDADGVAESVAPAPYRNAAGWPESELSPVPHATRRSLNYLPQGIHGKRSQAFMLKI